MISRIIQRFTKRDAESAGSAGDASTTASDAPVTFIVDTRARVGVLTETTHQLLDDLIQKYGLTTENGKPAEQALKSLAEWPAKYNAHGQPVFEHEADKASIHKCVRDIIESLGSRYTQVGFDINVKRPHLKAAQEASGDRDTDDMLRQLGRMSRQVKGAFNEEELEALKNPKDRLPLRRAIIDQRELALGMRILRAEAIELLGEEMMRPDHVHKGITGSPDSHPPDSSKAPKKGHQTYTGSAPGCIKPHNHRGPQQDPATMPVDAGYTYNRFSR